MYIKLKAKITGVKRKKKEEKRGKEVTEVKEARHREGSKFTVIKAWLSEKHRESNELCPRHQYTACMVLCKNWVYTQRLPLLSGTHNMRHYLTVCVSMCCLCGWVGTWVHVYEHTIVLPLSYISHTHKDTSTHTTKRAFIQTIVLNTNSRVQIIHPRYKVARGFPIKWQLHWIIVTPSQYQFDDTSANTPTYRRSDSIHFDYNAIRCGKYSN